MNDPSPVTSAMPSAPAASVRLALAMPRAFWLVLAFLLIGFALPLFQLARFALNSDLYSHIVLLPFISAHAVWVRRSAFRVSDGAYPKYVAAVFLTFGAILAALQFSLLGTTPEITADALVLSTSAFLLLLTAACLWFFGRTTMNALFFPLLLLGFTIPIPTSLIHHIETVMQHGSAAVAYQLFHVSGVAVFYEHLVFQLPGIALQVAPECSGIRSTLALLIVSIVTCHVFLRRPGHRLLVVLVVLPLALLRNGFRVFVIGELCVHYGPQMTESLIHRRGGPLFFGLSLIPFFLLVALLQRRERRAAQPARS